MNFRIPVLTISLFGAQALGMDQSGKFGEGASDYRRLELADPSNVLRAVPVVTEYAAPAIPGEPAHHSGAIAALSGEPSEDQKKLIAELESLHIEGGEGFDEMPRITFEYPAEKEREIQAVGAIEPDIESAFTAQELAKLKQPVAAPGKGKEPIRAVPATYLGKIKNWFSKHKTGLTDTAEVLALAAASGGTSYVGYCMLDNETIPALVSFASGERAEEVARKYGNAGLRMALAYGLVCVNDLVIRTDVPGLHACVRERGFMNTFDQPFNMYLTHTAVNGVQRALKHPSDQARQWLNIPTPVKDRLLQVVAR